MIMTMFQLLHNRNLERPAHSHVTILIRFLRRGADYALAWLRVEPIQRILIDYLLPFR
jgi:hypothetical protein